MSNIDNKLDYLKETKQLIKQALIDKGQSVSDEDTFRSYADKVNNISGGIDTSDATATEDDVASGKVFYGAEGKKIGSVETKSSIVKDNCNVYYDNDNLSVSIPYGDTSKSIITSDTEIKLNATKSNVANSIGVTPDILLQGKTLLGIDGNATSDATATANDILSGKTAYIAGKKITGGIQVTFDTLEKTVVGTIYNMTNIPNYIYDINIEFGIALLGTIGTNTIDIYKITLDGLGDLLYTVTAPENSYFASACIGKQVTSFGKILITASYYTTGTTTRGITWITMSTQLTDITTDSIGEASSRSGFYITPIAINPKYPDIVIIGYATSASGSSYNSMGASIYQITQDGMIKKSTGIRYQSGWIDGVSNVKINWDITSTYVDFLFFNDTHQLGYQRFSYDALTFGVTQIEYMTDYYNCTAIIDNTRWIDNNELKSINGDVLTTLPFEVSNTDRMWYNDQLIFVLKPTNISVYTFDLSTNVCKLSYTRDITYDTRIGLYINASNIPCNYLNRVIISQGVNNEIQLLDFDIQVVPDYRTVELYNKKFYNTDNSTSTPNNVLQDTIFYNSTGKCNGSMPNNGELNYESLDTEQIIPAGYTSGGKISPSPMSQDEYDECLLMAKQIINP